MTGFLEVTVEQLEKAGFVDTGAEFNRSKILKIEGREIRIHYSPDSKGEPKGIISSAYDVSTGSIVHLVVDSGLLMGKYVPSKR